MIAILGPTGTGKSHLAIKLALEFKGEIVNADSRQVYFGMDIGTAKPSIADREIVPHHLYDVVNPDEEFDLAQYQQMAYRAIDEIHRKGVLPVLVGGSGQYIWAVIEGWIIPRVPADPELRQKLEKIAREQGIEVLFKQLQQMDPESGTLIDPRNVRRVVRALEVTIQSGKPFSQLRQKSDPGFDTLIIGLTSDRKEIYRRLDSRVDEMIRMGLEDETRSLLKKGYNLNLPAMNSIGYSQMIKYLQGNISLNEAITSIKHENHRFVRHQYAWFRLKDVRIHWLDIQMNFESQAISLIADWLNNAA